MSLSCYRNRHDPQDTEDAGGRAHRRVRAVVERGGRGPEEDPASGEAFVARRVRRRHDRAETGREETADREGAHAGQGRDESASDEESAGETPTSDQAALTT